MGEDLFSDRHIIHDGNGRQSFPIARNRDNRDDAEHEVYSKGALLQFWQVWMNEVAPQWGATLALL